MIDDSELLRRYVEERDEAAFRTLVDRHIQFVYTAARRRLNGDQHAAEDVAQLVFTAAAKQARVLGHGVLFPAWLYRTTRNVSVDFVRTQMQRRRREQEATAMNEPFVQICPDKLRSLLDPAIDELEEKDRAAIVLRFFSQCSFAQVGAAFRVSEDAGRMRVDRALVKLQLALTRRGITSTGVALGAVLANEALLAAPECIAARVCEVAISAVSAVAPGAALAIGFMSSIKTFVAGASVLVALGTATFQIVQWRIALAERADAERAAAMMAARARSGETEAQKAVDALAAIQQRLAALRAEQSSHAQGPSVVVAPAAPGNAAKPWDDRAEGTAFMKRHPEVRDALRDYLRARARFSYGPNLDSLALAPEQRERIEVYMMRGQGMGAPVPGSKSDERQLTLAMMGSDDAGDAAEKKWVSETLGSDGMRRLAEYQNQMAARDDAVQIVGTLWSSEFPITPAQATQLVTTIASHRTIVNWRSVYDWEGIAAEATKVLSSSQLNAIEGLRTQAEFNAVLSRPASVATAVAKKQLPLR